MKNINDFGGKIGGAKKDLAALRKGSIALSDEIIDNWNEKERAEHIKKDLVWKKPDYQKMYDEGTPREVVFYIKNIRDALPIKPYNNEDKYQHGYIKFVSEIKDMAMNLRSMSDVRQFKITVEEKFTEKDSKYGFFVPTESAYGCYNSKFNKALKKSEYSLNCDVAKKEFLYTEDEKLLKEYIRIIARPDDFSVFDATQDERNRDTLRITAGYTSARFYYYARNTNQDNKPVINMKTGDFDKDKYFIVSNSGDLVRHNIDTKEEATRIATAYALYSDLFKEAERLEKLENSKDNYKEKKKRQDIIPPELYDNERKADIPHRENDASIVSKEFLTLFKVYGGEFGNWTNQKHRQTSLDYSYDAFRDLAVALKIPYDNVSLPHQKTASNSLSIAFGARGHSRAMAHYEPARNVINLTKLKGAGSLAHEWGHALDCFVREEMGDVLSPRSNAKGVQKDMASHCYINYKAKKENPDLVNPFTEVIQTIRYKQNPNGQLIGTDYYKASLEADEDLCKMNNNGYWSSECEMFARAFACYVKDKLVEQGINSDYLCGHAELPLVPFPKGEERENINKAIDNLLDNLKEMSMLKHQVHDVEAEMRKDPLDKYRDTSVKNKEIGFSKEVQEFLEKNGIKTIGKLCENSIPEIKKFSDYKKVFLEDIVSKLEDKCIVLQIVPSDKEQADKDRGGIEKQDAKQDVKQENEKEDSKQAAEQEAIEDSETAKEPVTFTYTTAAQLNFFDLDDVIDTDLPTKDDIDFDNRIEEPLPNLQKEETKSSLFAFDLENVATKANVAFSFDNVTCDYSNDLIMRSDFSKCLDELSEKELENLLLRAGIKAEPEISTVLNRSLKLYVDTTLQDVEGVLAVSKEINGVEATKEYPFELVPKEKQFICDAAEKEFGNSISEELEKIQQYFYDDFEENLSKDKEYNYE